MNNHVEISLLNPNRKLVDRLYAYGLANPDGGYIEVANIIKNYPYKILTKDDLDDIWELKGYIDVMVLIKQYIENPNEDNLVPNDPTYYVHAITLDSSQKAYLIVSGRNTSYINETRPNYQPFSQLEALYGLLQKKGAFEVGFSLDKSSIPYKVVVKKNHLITSINNFVDEGFYDKNLQIKRIIEKNQSAAIIEIMNINQVLYLIHLEIIYEKSWDAALTYNTSEDKTVKINKENAKQRGATLTEYFLYNDVDRISYDLTNRGELTKYLTS